MTALPECPSCAWSQAQFLAAELDDAVTVLASAAVLAELNAHTTDQGDGW